MTTEHITPGTDGKLSRTLGLTTSLLVFVGYIVGASIFILPGTLGGSTGPGLFLSYILAAIPAIFSCGVAAFVGSAYPVPGAGFVFASRMFPPIGMATAIWTLVFGVTMGIPLLAFGFADYINYFIPGLNRQLVAGATVIIFTLVNCGRVTLTAMVQGVCVLIFCVGLMIFSIGGIVSGDGKALEPLFPNGLEPVFFAALTAYFSYLGTMVVMEMAGEIKNPSRNIPLTLIIGFSILLLVYTSVPIALMMNLPWDMLGARGNGSIAVITASETFLPPGWTNFIAMGALLAAGTSVNGTLLSQSRDVLAASREGLVPRSLGHVNETSHVPIRAVVFLSGLSLLAILYGANIRAYADVVVFGVMYLQAGLGYAAYRYPDRYPEEYAASPLRYPRLVHSFFSLGLMVFSIGIMGMFAYRNINMLLIFLVLLGVVAMIFRLNERREAKQNE
ncbi:APC family permease [Paremcibacter congregatus]|uniref:Amino acid permease n=1 Tax=Paremcibacter congregatus TaxID=2043170 RepID=A0A2G4YWN4_9PROT|nr:APC family permease [Paremcibacter congregatus]PHZ85103.1 hypothetical protein CRD36_08460 [Paremcibacter congregatus]PHZ86735.1 hypothetical protein CRD36_00095 [Paremcibacter congregatus]QDE26265.1 APC family permease [Paremcibacter congregatus]QDE27633.1 APC family permease [Paremcibacter congregatus]